MMMITVLLFGCLSVQVLRLLYLIYIESRPVDLDQLEREWYKEYGDVDPHTCAPNKIPPAKPSETSEKI